MRSTDEARDGRIPAQKVPMPQRDWLQSGVGDKFKWMGEHFRLAHVQFGEGSKHGMCRCIEQCHGSTSIPVLD